MGRIKNKTVKRAAREVIEKYYYKLTNDFDYNKLILNQVAEIPTKRLRNKIAGFTTHLMARIQRGPVRGISLKIQEEQRERLFDKPPKESRIQISQQLEVDEAVLKMLRDGGFQKVIDEKLVGKQSRFKMTE